MSATSTSLIVFACVFGGALAGMGLRAALPEHHRASESKDLIRSTMALIGTISALVLGLLVASAKSAYDSQRDELTMSSANILLLDRVLAQFGAEGQPARTELRRAVAGAADQIWHPDSKRVAHFDAIYDTVARLEPKTDGQRTLQAQASNLLFELSRSRWLLFARRGSSISTPLLVVVVFWLSINFVSFGLFASRNSTVIVALFVGALSVAAAIDLILEMDSPFQGLLQISDAPLRAVLDQLGR